MTKLETITNIIKETGLPLVKLTDTEIATAIYSGYIEENVNPLFRNSIPLESKENFSGGSAHNPFTPLHICSKVENGEENIYFFVMLDEEFPQENL
jgi:hypothetical protein